LPTPAEFAIYPIETNFVFSDASSQQGGVDPISGSFKGFGIAPGDFAAAMSNFPNKWHQADILDGASGYW